MIIKDEEAVKRLSSPINLMNQLKSLSENKRQSAMGLFGIGRNIEVKQDIKITVEKPKEFNPFSKQNESLVTSHPISTPTNVPDNLDELIENTDTQIKLGLAHDTALTLLNNSVKALSEKLDDVKADKLPSVISAASKVVESIRKERNEATRTGKDREVHYHFYTPQQRKVTEYEVIEVQ